MPRNDLDSVVEPAICAKRRCAVAGPYLTSFLTRNIAENSVTDSARLYPRCGLSGSHISNHMSRDPMPHPLADEDDCQCDRKMFCYFRHRVDTAIPSEHTSQHYKQ